MANELREISTNTNKEIFLLMNTVVIALAAIGIAFAYYRKSSKLRDDKAEIKAVIGWLVAFVTVQIIIDSVSWYTDESLADNFVRLVFSTLEYIFSYMCYAVYTECVMFITKCEKKTASIVRIISVLACIGIWMLVYFDKIFYYEWGVFTLRDTYWLAFIYPLAIMAFDTYRLSTYHGGKKRDRHFLLTFGWLPTIGFIAKMLFNDNFFARISNVVILVMMYINIIITSIRETEEAQKELVEARMNTMVSQIRPHFIFNALSSIIDLCPEHSEAQDALIQFAKYLRVNIDALSYSHPRLFDEELQHVKAYLTLEKYNYGDRLQIEYDIQEKNFTLPVLSLQPLVENAVKYGFVKNKKVHVLVRTTETDDAYQIIVEDNGGGFDEAAARSDDRRHTGIENVRYRLKEMVGGTLEYENIEGGTRAIVTIPKNND